MIHYQVSLTTDSEEKIERRILDKDVAVAYAKYLLEKYPENYVVIGKYELLQSAVVDNIFLKKENKTIEEETTRL